ncbi:TIGR01777 family oxidoreductase [Pseudidiomarina woesei]|uniref:TIGR01777 family protein n=1 Tax=Pseudidiomarina woesei TaxID=1381080 RepID=A0A0K6GWL1_9GAMM|nr:TIGR01777 family oxidoreductase [Pseudidiomarina woesei]CUA83096.1 TIGR01777 family protein [Pseudidiomarina woesei]
MKLLITGGTGLIGQTLIPHLLKSYQVTVTSRNPQRAIARLGQQVHVVRSLDEISDISEFYAVINLQGEGIADKRWSSRQKLRLEQSRWNITRQLTERIQSAAQPPQVFISGSAIGFYGPQGSTPVTETSVIEADDFAHHLCAEWERLALAADSPKTRVCVIRTGVVLAPEGGALKKMLPPYLLGLGGPLGHGKQGFSWVHIDDMVGIILFLLEHGETRGIYNATAPNPVKQQEFSRSLAKVLRKSHFMRVPAWVLKLMLGEMSDMLLTGQLVLPERLQQAGYSFEFAQVEAALKDCLLPPS